MYEDFFGLKERPFTLQPDPAFLFLSKRHRAAITLLEYSIVSRANFSVVSGEIGSGKTTLVRHLLNRLDRDVTVGLITNTHRALGELLQWVNLAFGLPYHGKEKIELYQQFMDFLIDQYAKGQRTVLIVDEAHNLDISTLEELRLLSNINVDKDQVLQMILVGQPELREVLMKPALMQLAQRVSVACHIEPLSPEETDEYIRHRMTVAGGNPDIFRPAATRFIYHQTGGIPRMVNKLCDMALVYAFAEQKPVIDVKLVFDVVREQIQGGLSFYKLKGDTEGDVRVPEVSSEDAAPDELTDVAPQRMPTLTTKFEY
jgi:putative secretion ATPase (PEP-CTERM system associated)